MLGNKFPGLNELVILNTSEIANNVVPIHSFGMFMAESNVKCRIIIAATNTSGRDHFIDYFGDDYDIMVSGNPLPQTSTKKENIFKKEE